MENICADCKYYLEHYIKVGKAYQKFCLGHCISIRSKQRQAGDRICKHFKPKTEEIIYK